jgi:hypothetical protein
VSRRNALKHGLTATVVLPDDAAKEVERRDETLQHEMRPSGLLSAILIRRFAFLSVRLELCERHDAAGRAARVRHAEARFDDDRLTAIEEAFDHLADAPATYLRRLLQTSEGLDRVLQAWHDLRDALEAPEDNGWNFVHVRIVANLLGGRPNDFPVPRLAALAEAVFGNFHHLRPADGAGLDNAGRREWARRELARGIEAEVAELEARREAFDDEALELDRAEACERALFDPSPEAERYRKYEAATERGIYPGRTHKFRKSIEVRHLQSGVRQSTVHNPLTGKDLRFGCVCPGDLPDPEGVPAGGGRCGRNGQRRRGLRGAGFVFPGRPAGGP